MASEVAMVWETKTWKIRHVNIGVAEVCMWLGPSHRQAKQNEKNSGVDGITYVL